MTARKPAGPTPIVIDAVRAERPGEDPSGFTYTVLIDPVPPTPARAPGDDRRGTARRRTRLRSAKIIDPRGRFVTECVVHDLSADGVRLRLPATVTIPSTFQVYDDQSGLLQNARLSWQRDGEAGVRFVALANSPRDQVIAADMRRKYYRMPR